MSPHDGRACPTSRALIIRHSSSEVSAVVDSCAEIQFADEDRKPTDVRTES